MQRISAIPADFKDNNQSSAIHCSPDGKFVYAANRGHNSIAIFKVDEKQKCCPMLKLFHRKGIGRAILSLINRKLPNRF